MAASSTESDHYPGIRVCRTWSIYANSPTSNLEVSTSFVFLFLQTIPGKIFLLRTAQSYSNIKCYSILLSMHTTNQRQRGEGSGLQSWRERSKIVYNKCVISNLFLYFYFLSNHDVRGIQYYEWINKQLLDEVFVISRTIKVEAGVGVVITLLLLHWRQARQSERAWHDYP